MIFNGLIFALLISTPLVKAQSDLSIPKIESGKFIYGGTDKMMPWGGYWWKFEKSPIASSKNSPLQKFDRFVEGRMGKNPGATKWELKNHFTSHDGWEGHCDGLAAASIMFPEPTKVRKDPKTGAIFFPSDIKALYTKLGSCIDIDFYGQRYNGPSDDPKDPSPVLFHSMLKTYLESRKSSFVMDVRRLENVRNDVVSKAEVSIESVPNEFNSYIVKALLTLHDGDFDLDDSSHKALTYTQLYEYKILTDDQNKAVSGNWISDSNPDFMWVPRGLRKCNRSENSAITLEMVEAIEALPEINPEKSDFTGSFSVTLLPKQSALIYFPKIEGTNYSFKINQKGFGDGTLLFHGTDRLIGDSSTYRLSPKSGVISVPSKVSRIESLEIRNTTNSSLSGYLSVEGFQYYNIE